MENTIQDKKISHRTHFCSRLVAKEDIKEKVILDIGSSDTYWMSKILLKNKAKFVVAIDPAIKKEIKSKEIESYTGDVFNKKLNNKKFHTAVMFDVIEHIPQDTELKTLKRINSLLYKNGKLYLTTPNNSLFINLLDPAWLLGHRHYTQEKLQNLLKKAGFTVIESGKTGGVYESIRICWLYIQKYILRRNSFTYPAWLWYKSLKEFDKPGSMTNWLIAEK